MPYKDPAMARAKTRERLRRYRAANPGYSTTKNAAYNAENREKYLAHKAVERAVKTGRLIRCPCVVCGLPKAHGHYDDYSKPLDVIWLCAIHHAQRHIELAEKIAA